MPFVDISLNFSQKECLMISTREHECDTIQGTIFRQPTSEIFVPEAESLAILEFQPPFDSPTEPILIPQPPIPLIFCRINLNGGRYRTIY